MRVIMSIVIMSMVGCWSHIPGDPFEINVPETLITICHADPETPAVVETMNLNRSRAEWHLKKHQFDILGVCYTPPKGVGL